MNELVDQVMMYLRGAWQYRWYIHLIAWPLCIGGWAFVHKLPDQFQSHAKVYVDTDSVLRPLLQGLAVRTDINQQVTLMTRTLLSRPNLEKVASMTSLDVGVKSPLEKEELIRRLQTKINIEGKTSTNLYTINAIDKDPVLAKELVQSLLTIFIESSLGGARTDSDSAQKFLNDQIREYENRLAEAESRLKEFKQKNIGMMPANGQDYFARLQEAMLQLETARLLLEEETRKREELLRQQSGEEPLFGIMESRSHVSSDISTSVDSRISELENKLDNLLLTYTENHPDVATIRRTIDSLKKIQQKEFSEKQAVMAKTATNQAMAELNQNPVYQRLKISISEVESTIAGLKVRVNQYQQNVIKLKSMVNTIPQVEAEFAQLNRDYAINKKNYESLIARRESAKISDDADKSADAVKFQVIESPAVPIQPVAPNRFLFSSVILIGGIAVGCAFAFFLSQIKPTFQNRKSIIDTLGVTYLGSVSMVRTSKQILMRKLEVVSFGLAFLGLIAMYAGYILIQKFMLGSI